MTPLDFSVCAEAQTKGKKKDLQDAYAIAAGKHDLDYYKNLLREHERAREEEMEEQAAVQAEKEAKLAKKGKRKSSVAVEPEEDVDMESPKETPSTAKKGTKKRKANEAETENEKVGFYLFDVVPSLTSKELTHFLDPKGYQGHA